MESEYHAMENAICEFVWVRNVFTNLDFTPECPMRLYCDNQTVVHITKNSVFHEYTKYIEVDCHLVRQKIK